MRRLILLILLLSSLASCSPTEQVAPEPVTVPEAKLRDRAAIENGRLSFRRYCALCHGLNADGRGVRREGLSADPRDFHDPVWRERATPVAIFRTITDGVSQSSMPSFRALSEDERWDLVAYILSLHGGSEERGGD